LKSQGRLKSSWNTHINRGGFALPLIVIRVVVMIPMLALFVASSKVGERQVRPSPKDKCPVCGMFVSKYPDFVAEILFKDGSYAVFDGTKDMFKYCFNLKKYQPMRDPSDIDRIFVTGYYHLTLIDASEAYYVLGSDVFGPMGKELIPLENEAQAKTFISDHKGRSILRFQDITLELINDLD
jgi:copper chaperone NosL